MWQLSFSGLSESDMAELRAMPPAKLLAEARSRLACCFEPTQLLVAHTSEADVWAIGLMDRDPPLARPRHLQSLVLFSFFDFFSLSP